MTKRGANSRRITCGIGCVWGMPSLSPLSSLVSGQITDSTIDFFAYVLQKNLKVANQCTRKVYNQSLVARTFL